MYSNFDKKFAFYSVTIIFYVKYIQAAVKNLNYQSLEVISFANN